MQSASFSKRSYYSLLLFNFTFFMMDTTSSYFSIYLNEIGLSKSMIGLITGVAAAAAMFAQPFLGVMADSSRSKNRLLQLLILITAVLYPLILLNQSFLYILILYALYYICRRAEPSLNVSMSVEYSELTHHDYGPIRMMGALGYAMAMYLVGQISASGTTSTFYVFSTFCVLNMLLIFLLPPFKGHNSRQKGEHLPVRIILKNRPILLLMVYMMLYTLVQGIYFSYYSLYFTETLHGSNELYGTMLAAGALFEIPFLFLADRLVRKVGTKRILLILGIIGAVRWLLTYLISSPAIQFAIQMLNCLNMLNSVAISLTLSRMVAPQFKTTIQTLLYTFESAVSILISSFLGGIFADLVGIRPMFLIAALIGLSSSIVFPGLLMKSEDLQSVQAFEA